MTQLVQTQRLVGATLDPDIAVELGAPLPLANVRRFNGTGVATSEAFGAGIIKLSLTLAGTGIASGEVFGVGAKVWPKGATGTHPTTTDARTTVTGPEDLSGKKFTNNVLLTGSGLTGSGVAFNKTPTFQDCDATLSDVWFDQTSSNPLCLVVGATTLTNVTIRRFTALQFQGNMPDISGTHVGTVNFYNGLLRPLPAPAGLSNVFPGVGIPSSEAFGAGAIKLSNTLHGVGIPSSEAFGTGALSVAGLLGPATPINQAMIGPQTYGTWAPGAPSTDPRDGPETYPGEQLHRAQRWVDLWLDKSYFGRADKTPPPLANIYAGSVTIGTNGIPVGSGASIPTSCYTVVTVGSVVTTTLNMQCWSIHVTGDKLHPERLVIAGKLWVVDPNADDTPTLAAFNATLDSTVGDNDLAEFHDCTLALQNTYLFGGNLNPILGNDDVHCLDTSTPMFDGFLFAGFAHDGQSPGGGTPDLWLRRGTFKPHPFIAAYTNPVLAGGLPLYDPAASTPYFLTGNNDPNPTAWSAGRTYNRYDVVTFGADSFYCLVSGTVGVSPPSGTQLGRHNASWQFYGNMHADLVQVLKVNNKTSRATHENVFWYQGQHVSIYCEMAAKVKLGKLDVGGTTTVLAKSPPPAWDASTVYHGIPDPTKTTRSSCVRGSNDQEFYAVQASGPGTAAGPQDPTLDTSETYWTGASAHNVYGEYCLTHGNNVSIDNATLDHSNGLRNSVVALGFQNPPVQGSNNSDVLDGVNVRNQNNVYADGSGPIAGST